MACLASCVCLVLFPLAGCSRRTASASQTTFQVGQTQAYTQARTFVLEKLLGNDGGVHTNALPGRSSGDTTRGYDVLAESQGLLMEYAVQTQDAALFRKAWGYVQARLLLEDGLVAWRETNGEPAGGNATVDDLRICKALRLAAAQFGEDAYRKAADTIANALYQHCRSGAFLLSGDTSSSPLLMSYLDLDAIEGNAESDSRWNALAKQARALLKEAHISSGLPLYRETYSVLSHSFKAQTAYDTTASLLAFTYQASGTSGVQARAWLRSACGESGLFASYTQTGAPASAVQSTALYALAMLAARRQDDEALYQSARTKLLTFQVSNKSSAIYGGFGSADTGEAYSFDNLLALLALTPTSGAST